MFVGFSLTDYLGCSLLFEFIVHLRLLGSPFWALGQTDPLTQINWPQQEFIQPASGCRSGQLRSVLARADEVIELPS
jgi:hypothetical protein